MKPNVATLSGGVAVVIVVGLCGCGSAIRYQAASDRVPAAQLLNVPFSLAPVNASLATVIICGGPGSWKREAMWDEYVVTLKNPGSDPITLTAAELQDFAGSPRAAGVDPWKLEDESAELVKEFRRDGVAFAKKALPAGFVAGLAAGYSEYARWALGQPFLPTNDDLDNPTPLQSLISGPGRTMVGISKVASFAQVPVLVAERALANREDRDDIQTEFRLRRLPLPITLAPGQTRVGCFFFPVGPNPRALKLAWRRGGEQGTLALPLGFLRGLHVPRAATNIAAK